MRKYPNQSVIVGMSGGVDSSVAALLLKEQGYLVKGLFMKNWEEEDVEGYCPGSQDMQDAQHVCDALGIELLCVNFASEYWERVFSYFLLEYQLGRTPNPDILCNKEIKFRAFLNYAKNNGADFIATGHYVRTYSDEEGVHLLKGKDPQKDQSYFLYALSQSQLKQSLFPIGEFEKTNVRDIAKKAGFSNHKKKDSTGICFIGERKFKSFLTQYLPTEPGNIKTPEGQVIGKHDGLMYYTIGQRQGLGIGGHKNSLEAPWYVANKDLKNNALIVVQGEHPLLFGRTLIAEQIHWITKPHSFATLSAKIRYRQIDQLCHLEKQHNDARYQVTFETPQRAITPGQSIVFYQNEECIGGGIIVEKIAVT